MRSSLVALIVFALAGCATPPPPASPAVPIEESVRPGINESYDDPDVGQWVERFEREGREIYDLRRDIVAACGFRPGHDVADIGAGTGLFVPLLADAVGPRGVVYAIDIVPEFVALIADRAAREGRENIRPVVCTERSVELPSASIDRAFICDVYHHFEYPRSSMTSVRRALRRGGEVVVIDFEREPGVSSDWILDHVRAGKATVIGEIESFGFDLVEEVELLESNYFLRFRVRPGG